MTEQDLLSAALNLADLAEVHAFLGKVDVTPELRRQLEEEWSRHRSAHSPDATPIDPSVVDSRSVQFQNTVLFRKEDAPDSGTEQLGKSTPGGGTNAAVSMECQGGVQIESVDQANASSDPTTFGRYETRRVLGSGAFGRVYLGYDPQLNRQVAIKVPILKAGDSASRAQFLLEARQLAALKHPGIVAVYDISVDADQCYIVSDYLEGESLSDWLKGHRVEWPQVAQIVIKIADALAHAHTHRIVHRDLKPANIIMTDGQNPVLVDFGLALSDSSSTSLERGVIAGTPSYMSPEQARGEGHRIDGRTDIYTLGVMMYLMLTGRLPFTAQRIEELLQQVQNDEPQPPRQLNPAIPRELENVCLTAMAKSLRHRYTTATDLADDLRKILAPLPEMPAASVVPPVAQPSIELLPPVQEAIQSVAARSQVDSPSSVGQRSSSVQRSSSTVRRVREAERRRVTVVKFGCDVFTSADILETLDAEEQEEVLQEFQQLCREVTIECGGAVAQLSEDGLRACFGYPVAFEDATQRAVRAGLRLIEKMAPLRDRVRRKHMVELSAISA
ncbi:MAG: protein kinase, partial [Candidatus Saccharimonas sp.]|nr:protein kinase [Planctomycetaceae bacterium]